MPNTKSQEKRDRQNIKRSSKNQTLKSKIKTLIKNLEASVEAKQIEESQKDLKIYFKALDKAASARIVHKNYAANKKSRAAKLVNSLEANKSIKKPRARKKITADKADSS
jgi:small subunit ribosomal protein S20